MKSDASLLCVTGLPRSGSTLLCQLLGMHPSLFSDGYSSPLLQSLTQLRHNLSDNPFLLAQLDVDFERTYKRLQHAYQGFMRGWFAETDKPWVVDKNRGWLNQDDLLHTLNPQARLLVCVRELGQIVGSVEAQHQKTVLLDFSDHLANLSAYDRASGLLGKEGVVGAPLRSIEAMQDKMQSQQQQVYYVVFEHLMQEPVVVMQSIFQWLGIDEIVLDVNQLPVHPHESDSHYRFKYPHQTRSRIREPQKYTVPARIHAELLENFKWFYQSFYPAYVK
jgi:sulfotransferase